MPTIVLGCTFDFHNGVHPVLAAVPPAGVTYQVRTADHLFLQPHDHSPYERFGYSEFVDFGAGDELVHSVYFPVVGRSRWLADLDEVGFTLLSGRSGFDPTFIAEFGGDWSPEFRARVQRRFGNMIAAYRHPSCKAVLFWSAAALNEAVGMERWMLGDGPSVFEAKGQVVYPAQPAIPPDALTRKWAAPDRLKVVFAGFDFKEKQGELALQLFQALTADNVNAQFTYIGKIPPDSRTKLPVSGDDLIVRDWLSREEFLATLADCHVLFHPSRGESLGLVLLEAAAAGAAVICARGGSGMRHIPELFASNEGYFLDRDTVSQGDELEAFGRLLKGAIEHPEVTRSIAARAHKSTSVGKLSVAARDAALGRIYSEALSDEHGDALSVEAIHSDSDLATFRLTMKDLARDRRRYFEKLGGPPAYAVLPNVKTGTQDQPSMS